MKKIYLLPLFLLCFLFVGCNDAEYTVINNGIYLTDAEGTSKASTLTLEDEVNIDVNVRLAKKSDQDVEIAIRLNPALLESYNEANNTEYYPVPDFNLPADAKVVIPAGEVAGSYRITVAYFSTNGKQYALGVELGDVLVGDVEICEAQSEYIYILSSPLKVSVPVVTGSAGNRITAAPETNWGITTNQWTIEFWARMSGFNKNNQGLVTSGSDDHNLYIRYGDANSPYNYLQVKVLGGQIETDRDLKANTWYHWAFVYDGTSFTIYRNGEQDVKFDPPAPTGGSMRIDKLYMIASGTYFKDQCGLSQLRLWKTAISQTQIKNNMYYSINPENADLIGYWPMDEGEGNTLTDITGNGHDAVIGNNILVRWDHDIRFDK